MALLKANMSKLSPNLLKLRPIMNSSLNRMYGTIWQMFSAKLRKLITGSERAPPPPKPDRVLEEMYMKGWSVPYARRFEAKWDYNKYKSHQKLVEHNKRIRKLNHKITGDVYSTWDYANRW